MKKSKSPNLPFWQSTFFVKLMHWEYWPSFVVYAPTAFFYLYFAIRSRRLFYFTPVNPVIETGGVFGESKINILNRIPAEVLPKTAFIAKENQTLAYIINAGKNAGITFPFIAKPDVGERGFLVEIIKNEAALVDYLKNINAPFIIQELITSPIELSVLHYRMPDATKGKITSICIKRTLFVIGDGQSTVAELMLKKPRARLQFARFQENYPTILKRIPAKGEAVELEPVANHSRGTTFLNGNHLHSEKLERVFDNIAFQMDGIYYGRFDLKCESIELLEEGKGISILEFNGVAGEPAHIYDPEFPVWKAYRDIYRHFKIIYQIGRVQQKKGITAMSLSEMRASYRRYNKYLAAAKV